MHVAQSSSAEGMFWQPDSEYIDSVWRSNQNNGFIPDSNHQDTRV